MSYETNWGFREATDEFGVHIAGNDHGCEIKTVESNEFLVEIELCSEIKDLILQYESKLSDQIAILRITSDFELSSAPMVLLLNMHCRYQTISLHEFQYLFLSYLYSDKPLYYGESFWNACISPL
jgi:hypothetical protein